MKEKLGVTVLFGKLRGFEIAHLWYILPFFAVIYPFWVNLD